MRLPCSTGSYDKRVQNGRTACLGSQHYLGLARPKPMKPAHAPPPKSLQETERRLGNEIRLPHQPLLSRQRYGQNGSMLSRTKKPTLRLWLAAPQGGAFRLGAARRQKNLSSAFAKLRCFVFARRACSRLWFSVWDNIAVAPLFSGLFGLSRSGLADPRQSRGQTGPGPGCRFL